MRFMCEISEAIHDGPISPMYFCGSRSTWNDVRIFTATFNRRDISIREGTHDRDRECRTEGRNCPFSSYLLPARIIFSLRS